MSQQDQITEDATTTTTTAAVAVVERGIQAQDSRETFEHLRGLMTDEGRLQAAGKVKVSMTMINSLYPLMQKGFEGARMIEIADLRVDPDINPRTLNRATVDHINYLKESIKTNGFFEHEPLVVFLDQKPGASKYFFSVVEGGCRFRAAVAAKAEGAPIKALPCIIRTFERPEQMVVTQYMAQHRLPLQSFEQAVLVKRLASLGHEQVRISTMLNCSHTHVKNLLRIADSPEWLLDSMRKGLVTQRAAIELLKAPEAETELVREAVATLSARVQHLSPPSIGDLAEALDSESSPDTSLAPAAQQAQVIDLQMNPVEPLSSEDLATGADAVNHEALDAHGALLSRALEEGHAADAEMVGAVKAQSDGEHSADQAVGAAAQEQLPTPPAKIIIKTREKIIGQALAKQSVEIFDALTAVSKAEAFAQLPDPIQESIRSFLAKIEEKVNGKPTKRSKVPTIILSKAEIPPEST